MASVEDIELGNYSKAALTEDGDVPEEEVDPKDTTTKGEDPPTPSLGNFFAVSKQEWPMLTVALILMALAEVAGLYIPLLLADVYDVIVDPAKTADDMKSKVNTILGAVFVIHWSGMFCGFLRSSIIGVAGERVVARLRKKLYEKILIQEMAFFDAKKSGDLVSRLGSDTQLLQTATTSSFPEVVIGLVKSIACVCLMVVLSPKLAGITAAIFVGLILVCVPVGQYIGKISKLYQDALAKASGASTEALGSMRTVRSFVAEDKELKRYVKIIGNPDLWAWWWPTGEKDTTYRYGSLKGIIGAAFGSFAFGLAISAMYGTLWIGFIDVVNDDLSLGKMVAFQSYVFNIGLAVATISGHVVNLFTAKGAAARVFELLDREPLISPEGGAVPEGEFEGPIVFKDVNFSYPSRPDVPVLDNFNLILPKGQSVALVGPSGSGKSTVVGLLLRFYDAASGTIQVGDAPIPTLSQSYLRSLIGLVSQEPVLFGLTIAENVRYGLPPNSASTQSEVEAACRLANCHGFITSFPDGYKTFVGERGVKLSGGQKQRIALARALLLNPSILLLDEATSALDAESEHVVQKAIDDASVGRTTLIIAHRLSTVRKADRIAFVEGGRVQDVGKHEELMKRCSQYKDLVKRQLSDK